MCVVGRCVPPILCPSGGETRRNIVACLMTVPVLPLRPRGVVARQTAVVRKRPQMTFPQRCGQRCLSGARRPFMTVDVGARHGGWRRGREPRGRRCQSVGTASLADINDNVCQSQIASCDFPGEADRDGAKFLHSAARQLSIRLVGMGRGRSISRGRNGSQQQR
jgi:hypothetical protein